MPQPSDFKALYQDKCIEFQQISEQFNELQQQSNLIMNDLEDQIKQQKRKNQLLQRQVKQLKEKKKYIASTIERQLDQAQKQKNQFKSKFKDFEKKVIQLEIINQNLENQLRATKSTLDEYQMSAERTMQQLAILRVELEESTNSNQEQIARLRLQLKQTEQQIDVMHKKTKHRAQQLADLSPFEKVQPSGILSLSQTPSGLKHDIQNLNELNRQKSYKGASISFKQTLNEIRSYMQSIDTRKQQIRKTLLQHRQFVSS